MLARAWPPGYLALAAGHARGGLCPLGRDIARRTTIRDSLAARRDSFGKQFAAQAGVTRPSLLTILQLP